MRGSDDNAPVADTNQKDDDGVVVDLLDMQLRP